MPWPGKRSPKKGHHTNPYKINFRREGFQGRLYHHSIRVLTSQRITFATHMFQLLSWNSRGINSLLKVRTLHILRDISILCLQETKLKCIGSFLPKKLWPHCSSLCWASIDSTRNSGGIMTLQDAKKISVSNIYKGDRWIEINWSILGTGIDCSIYNVYLHIETASETLTSYNSPIPSQTSPPLPQLWGTSMKCCIQRKEKIALS